MKYDWKDVGEILQRADDSVAKAIVGAVKTVYCAAYNLEPYWVYRDNPLTPALSRGALKALCGEDNVPPPPVAQIVFGQCEVPYRWRPTFRISRDNASLGLTAGDLVQGIADSIQNGAITGVQFPIVPNNGFFVGIALGGAGNNQTTFKIQGINVEYHVNDGNSSPPGTINADIVTQSLFERVDGLPDECGTPPPTYPPAPPPLDIDIIKNVVITDFDGGTTEIKVEINRDINNTINFPSIIRVGDVQVGIDVAGLTIGEININRRSGGGGGGSGEINPIPAPTPPDTEETEETEEVDSLEEDCPGLVAIVVTTTVKPSNASIISGRGAPNVELIGWVEFKRENNYFPRTFLSFDKARIEAPGGADGYAITFKVGYRGKVKKIIELPEDTPVV